MARIYLLASPVSRTSSTSSLAFNLYRITIRTRIGIKQTKLYIEQRYTETSRIEGTEVNPGTCSTKEQREEIPKNIMREVKTVPIIKHSLILLGVVFTKA